MLIARTRRDLRAALEGAGDVALVPTMGALHAGHRALVAAARARATRVVLSIFVNPTQFAPGEDYAAYPRDERADLGVAEADGVDVVFAPGVDEVYPPGPAAAVDPGPLGAILEGAERPGHFRGVATVVTKLFGMVRPQRALFGEKDWQQLVVIRRVTRDLELGVDVVGVPTVREPDGLALSSRNVYLQPAERRDAATLARGLHAAAELYRRGEREEQALLAAVRTELAVEPQYLELRERDSLAGYDPAAPAVLALAAHVGRARLIDNVHLVPTPEDSR